MEGGTDMIKTIKIKKQFRLDELIKYVWDNDIKEKDFYIQTERDANHPRYLTVDVSGMIRFSFRVYPNDTFTVEVEEEITRSTIFDCLVRVEKDGVVERTHCSISGIKNENTICIYALLDGKLELIYERNDDSSQCAV